MARGKLRLKSKRFAESKSFHEPNFLAGLFFLEIVSLQAAVSIACITPLYNEAGGLSRGNT